MSLVCRIVINVSPAAGCNKGDAKDLSADLVRSIEKGRLSGADKPATIAFFKKSLRVGICFEFALNTGPGATCRLSASD